MVRSSVVVVSDDQSVIAKAQQFCGQNGLTVQVMTPEQWDSMNTPKTEVPSLVGGVGSEGGAKVLQFPGNFNNNNGTEKRGVATINQLESVAIENAIVAFKGNLTEAAKALGIGRATLYRKVKQYNIDPSAARKKKAA